MKIKNPLLSRIAVALALGLSSAFLSDSHAATVTWNNTGSDFNTGANWSPGLPTTADTAALPNAVSVVNPDLSANIMIQTLTIDNSGADYNITRTGTSALTLSGTTPAITITGGGATTIAPEVRLGNTRTINTGSAALTLQGGLGIVAGNLSLTLTNSTPVVVSAIATRDGTAATTRILTLDGTGSMSVTGPVAPGSGNALIKLESAATYSGTFALSGSNTFSAATVWRAGTLQIAHNEALSGQNINLGSAIGGAKAVNLLTTAPVTTSSGIGFNANAVNTSLTVGGSHTSGTSTYSGTVSLSNLGALNNGLKVTSAVGGTVDFTGVISGTSTANHFITKVGGGTVRFTGSNTYAGGTRVSAGTLLINNSAGSGTGAGAVAVNGGVLGGTGTISGAVTVAGNASILGGDGVTALENLALSGGLTLQDTSIIQLTLGGSGAHSTLSKTGGPTWTFDNNQSFTFIDAGAAVGTYDNIITGLGADPLTQGSWTITNVGWAGTFTYDGSNIDLTLTAIPEPQTAVIAVAGMAGTLLMARRRRQTT